MPLTTFSFHVSVQLYSRMLANDQKSTSSQNAAPFKESLHLKIFEKSAQPQSQGRFPTIKSLLHSERSQLHYYRMLHERIKTFQLSHLGVTHLIKCLDNIHSLAQKSCYNYPIDLLLSISFFFLLLAQDNLIFIALNNLPVTSTFFVAQSEKKRKRITLCRTDEKRQKRDD